MLVIMVENLYCIVHCETFIISYSEGTKGQILVHLEQIAQRTY